MSILAWIEDQRRLKLLNAPKYNHPASDGSQGLWTRCDNCGVILYIKHLKENQRVCFGCGFHLQMNSQERIDNLIDSGTWRPFDETLSPCDPLEFRDQKQYTERLREAQERTGLQDAIQTGTGMLDGIPIALGVMDFHFMGGSMGSAVGEKITRLIEYATQEGLTLILVCASGGARMQEGILSLMQMAKISAALQVYQSCANLLYISVLTSPTTGGVTASFAMLGDLIFAEPKALIGFAGRRVIEQTLQEQLPDDFQTSEYLLHHGLLDLIVPRSFLKQALSETITLYKDAPLKVSGIIPHGVQQTLGLVSQEKVRRNWLLWKKAQEDSGLSFEGHALALPVSSSDGIDKGNNQYTKAAEIARINSVNTGPLASLDKKSEFEMKAGTSLPKSEFSYREILLSFHTMFQFIADEFLTSNFDIPSINEINPVTEFKTLSERGKSEDKLLPTLLENQKAELQSEEIDFLNKAISLASHETIQWRAFYMNSKLEPKKVLLEKFQNSKEKSFLSSEAQGKNSEKYFFYKADLMRD
uniref:Acetyl-coenzyme A carboxylase carboxyl transferase subunit beta, chloroplastic n=1 Tax=Microthamnion kuetzingianum TaxID=34148 RepID=A0A097KNA4_9CHLO|nr:beta subunit of acetyl-CoA carboxylase carboxytransferase [Microthamnion kuetzingianum]AIT94661.1 beta subunit of acetyl-CoA carboxylase carboxytransferase [Microthamnion kuetzingianum]